MIPYRSLARAAACVLLPGLAHAAVVQIPASADAVLFSTLPADAAPLANGAGDYLHAGVNGSAGGSRALRSILRFDVAGAVPSGATITQAVLRVVSGNRNGTVTLRRVTQAWTEGPSDPSGGEAGGTIATTGDVTWNHASYPSTPWSTTGGSVSTNASLVTTLTFAGPQAWQSAQLLADVRGMQADPATNFGWRLENNDESTPSNAIQFASRTNPTPADRPVLEVSYSPTPLPVLYYDFSEGSGTVITNKGTAAVNGTLNGLAGDERWVTGPRGGALQFDGETLAQGDFISTHLNAATLGFNSSNYTAAAWIQFTRASGDNMVFGQTNATGTVLHDGVRNSRLHQGHWGNDTTGGAILQTGVWYHVVYEYRQGYQRVFLNGNLDAGPFVKGLLPNASEVVIGNSLSTGAWGFQGRLDEVVVYNRTLNLAQIRHLASGGDPRALPTNEVANNTSFWTAPFGPGGTWNLYQFRGTAVDRPRTWVDAENQAVATPDPSGLTSVPGHLADVTARQENFFLERIAGFASAWIGLTDHEAYGGAEAINNRNGLWKWTSGAAYSYQNWSTGEPNNSTAAGEDGIHLVANTGTWNDNLNGLFPQVTNAPIFTYVVEWAVANPTPVPGAQVMEPVLPATLAGRGPANAAFGVRAVSNVGTFDNIVRAVAAIQGGQGTIIEGKTDTINANDPQNPGGVGSVPGDAPFVGDTGADDNYILHVYKGRLNLPQATTQTFVLRTDDGGAMRIRGQAWTTAYGSGVIDIRSPDTLYRERGAGEMRGVITLPAGLHDIEVIAYEQTGGASHELYAAAGNNDVDFDTPAWRLVGQRSRGSLAIPGIRLVNGTNWLVRASAPGGNAAITNLNNLANAELELSNDPNVVRQGWSEINFVDPQDGGSGGSYGGNNPFPNGTAAADDDFAVEATGRLEIPQTGTYQFGFRGDDGGSLQIVGQAWSNLVYAVNGNSVISGDTLVHNANTGDSHTRGWITLNAGTYDLRVVYWERSGGAHLEVYGDSAANIFPDLLRGGGGRFVPDAEGLHLAVVSPIQLVQPVHQPQTGIFTLSWNSMPGTTYRLEWSTNHQDWNTLLTGIASQGTTTSVQLPDTFTETFLLFRIREE